MLFILSIFILIILSKKDTFTSTFFSLAFIYFFFFYIYPLSLLTVGESYSYVGYNYLFTNSDFIFAVLSGLLFIIGFFLPDIFLVVKRRKSKISSDLWSFSNYKNQPTKFKKLFYILLLLVITYYLVGLINPSRAINEYSVRSGEVKGNWLRFFYSIFIDSLFYALLFTLVYTNHRKAVTCLLLYFIIYLLTGASGRAVLVINLLIFVMYILKLRVRLVILSSLLLTIISLPIILNLKLVIFEVSVNHRLPNLLEIYMTKPDSSLIMANFGHPLVSLLKADSLIDQIGYRYLYDFLQGFLFYLKAVGLDFGDSLIYYNSDNLINQRASIIPTGFLAFGYIQLSFIGIIIGGIFYRLTGYITEYIYFSYNSNNNIIRFYFSIAAAASFYHGEVRVMVITFLLPMLILYFFKPTRLLSA